MGSFISLENGEKSTDEILQEDSVETSASSEEPLAKKKSKVKSNGAKTKGLKKKLVKTKKRLSKSDT